MSGYFEIGIFNLKTPENLGTLWRSAYSCGAAGIFTIGKRYKKQGCDCFSTAKHIPLRSYLTFDDFLAARPDGAVLVAVESGGTPLRDFKHPKRALYLLGAEDSGIPGRIINSCNELVTLDSIDPQPYNVAVAGSVVMYDRMFLR